MPRTRVKICGITNPDDARAAVDYGADALGFIFVPESPRFVDDARRDEILWSVPPFVTRVAVSRTATELPRRYDATFSAVQFYDTEMEQSWHWMSGELDLIYAARVRDEASLQKITDDMPWMATVGGRNFLSALLLDAYHEEKLGGSGETFNWDLAVEAKRRFDLPVILAGGLTPDNVGDAIARARPYAVDVSSGVEAEPGRKDHAKLRAFLRAVRRADALLDP